DRRRAPRERPREGPRVRRRRSRQHDVTLPPRFKSPRLLGEGGMGVVYEAYDQEQRTRVAVKTLREMSPSALLRFKQEFRTMQDVQHVNLVQLGELMSDEGRWFFTMELVSGESFLEHVRGERGGGFDEDRLRSALWQLAQGLGALH